MCGAPVRIRIWLSYLVFELKIKKNNKNRNRTKLNDEFNPWYKNQRPNKSQNYQEKNNIYRRNCLQVARNLKWGRAEHIARLPIHKFTHLATFWSLELEEDKPGRPVKRWRDQINSFLMNKLLHRVALDQREWERVRSTLAYFGPGVHRTQPKKPRIIYQFSRKLKTMCNL